MERHLKIIILLSIFSFVSCEKEDDLISQSCETDCTEITGKLMTDNGTTPIVDHKITVVWENTNQGTIGGTIRTKATTRTDDTGEFNLKFFIRDDELQNGFHRIYHDVLNDDEYLRADLNGISVIPSVRDTTFVRNHNALKKAFINLSLLNLDEIEGNDRLWTNFKYMSPSGFTQPIDASVRGWTAESEANHLIEIAGNQPVIVEIDRKINNVSTTETDTLFVSSGTTIDYSVDFNN